MSTEKVVWKKISNDTVETYRRSAPVEAHNNPSDPDILILFDIATQKTYRQSRVLFELNTKFHRDVPRNGQQIYPVFEITTNHRPHSKPWAHLMGVGPFDNWHCANWLGVKIQWHDDDDGGGKWKERYLQCSGRGVFVKKNTIGSLYAYNDAMAIIRYLRQMVRTCLWSWEKDLSIADVHEMSFDNKEKQWIPKVLSPWGQFLPPKRHEKDAMLPKLERAVNSKTRVGGKTRGINGRMVCDTCFLKGKTSARECSITKPGTDQCEVCWLLGRECTWTKTAILQNDRKMSEALWFLRRIDETVEIDEPDLLESWPRATAL